MAGPKNVIIKAVDALPPELAVLVVAMLPVLELRGAIPLGIALGLPPIEAFFIALLGNLLPLPVLLVAIDPATRWLRRIAGMQRLIEWTYRRSQAKSGSVRRLGWWGLAFFVAIPLPTTGAWTGALIASILGYRPRSALTAIGLGAVVAGLVVTGLSVLGLIVLEPRF